MMNETVKPISMRDMLRFRVSCQVATITECKRRIAQAENEMIAAKQAVRQINQQISEIDKHE